MIQQTKQKYLCWWPHTQIKCIYKEKTLYSNDYLSQNYVFKENMRESKWHFLPDADYIHLGCLLHHKPYTQMSSSEVISQLLFCWKFRWPLHKQDFDLRQTEESHLFAFSHRVRETSGFCVSKNTDFLYFLIWTTSLIPSLVSRQSV